MEREMRSMRIFGDSILKGVVYREEVDRYVTLEHNGFDRLERLLGMTFQNSTMFGCTVTKGMQLLQKAIGKGLACDGVLLEYGGNDCDFLWDEVAAQPDGEHFPKTSLATFEQTLKDMIAVLESLNIVPVLMTLPPIDSVRYLAHICRKGLSRSNILHWLGDIHNIERYQELYSLRIATVALQTRTKLVDIRSEFLARRDCSSLICTDGIHPSEKGHAVIMDALAEFPAVVLSA